MGIFKNPKKILRRRRRFPRGRAAAVLFLASEPPITPSQPPRTDSRRFTPSEASDNERPANCLWRSHRSHRSHRGQTAGVSLQVKRVITSDPRLARRRRKKTTCLHRWFFCVGENLFFRAVSSQVSSAPASLTSVFGMGTGGPSRQSTPTIQFAASLDSFNIIPQPFENCKPFFKIFRKNFATKAAGLEKRLSKIVLNRASATRGFLKPRSRAHLPYTPSQPPRTQGWSFIPGKASDNERPATCPWRSHRSHRGQTAGVSLQVKRVITSDPRLARRRRKKTTCLHRWFFVLAKTYFSGPSPAKYLRRRRA